MAEMPTMELIPKGKYEQASYFLALIFFVVRPKNHFWPIGNRQLSQVIITQTEPLSKATLML